MVDIDARRQEMLGWFYSNFMKPSECDPPMSKEHGSQYVCGGPYYAEDLLNKHFGTKYPQHLIKEVVAILEKDESDWVKKDH